jgi:hypothetical protein
MGPRKSIGWSALIEGAHPCLVEIGHGKRTISVFLGWSALPQSRPSFLGCKVPDFAILEHDNGCAALLGETNDFDGSLAEGGVGEFG